MTGQNFDLYIKKHKISPKPMKPIVLRIYLGLNIRGSNFIYIFHYFASKNPVEIVANPQDADIAIFEYNFDITEEIGRNIPTVCLSKFRTINVPVDSYAACLPRGKKPMVVYTDSYFVVIEQMTIALNALKLKSIMNPC